MIMFLCTASVLADAQKFSLLSLLAASGCSIPTSAAVPQLFTQMRGVGITAIHQETGQDRPDRVGFMQLRSHPQSYREERLWCHRWWKRQRKDDAPMWWGLAEDAWGRKLCPPSGCRKLWKGLNVRALWSPVLRHKQSEEFLHQPCVRCPQQDKGPTVVHICPTTYIRGCKGPAR